MLCRKRSRAGASVLGVALVALVASPAFAISHVANHVFSIEDVQGGFDGSTVGPAGRVADPSILCGAPITGSPPCPADAAQPILDDGDTLYPVDSEFGFNVVDFLGAQPKSRDGDYGEGWVGTIFDAGAPVGVKVSNAPTDFFKVPPPLGTWCAGLGGNSVKCSTEHYSVMEHVLSCHEVIPYQFADPVTGAQQLLGFPGEPPALDCGAAELDDELQIIRGGDVTVERLVDATPGAQMGANDNTTILDDIATSSDYSVTLKDDGKPLYRWGTLIKRPRDVRLYAKLPLPQDWLDQPDQAFEVTRARLIIDHWVTNNPNDQLRPEDMENEGATGRKPSYRVENAGTPSEVWKSTRSCFEGDGDFIDTEEGAGDPTPIGAGTFFRNQPFAVFGSDPLEPLPFSADLKGGFSNAWYTSIDRDPFEWSYRDPSTTSDVFEFLGSEVSNDALGELVSGPRWRLRANKYGQDIPGLEIMVDPSPGSATDCLPPPPSKSEIKYEVGARTITEINLLDFADENGDGLSNDSPLKTSQGWIREDGNGVNVPVLPGLSVNGLPLTDGFDLAVYVKGDRKPTALYSARLEIEYGPPGSGDFDQDGVPDSVDNCTAVANPGQFDANATEDDDPAPGVQHYGNVCDADLDDDGVVTAADYYDVMQPCLGAVVATRPECGIADLDVDGTVSGADFYGVLVPALGSSPGPGVTEP